MNEIATGTAFISPLTRFATNEVPDAVITGSHWLQELNVWHLISRNDEARSCRDAANKRHRLGNVGIPLDDELKSFLGRYIDSQQRLRLAVIHCRGTANLDMGKVRDTLNIDGHFERLELGELKELGLDYGLINPFQWFDGFNELPVLQMFDESLLTSKGLPGTMMTNAGHLNWAIEFNCAELIEAMPKEHIKIANVIQPVVEVKPQVTPIGIITGNSPDSGMALWNLINLHVQERFGSYFHGDLTYPPVFVESLPGMGLSMELDSREQQVWQVLEQAVNRLCQQGAKILTIACNTTPYFAPQLRELCQQYEVEFISIADATKHYLEEKGISEVSLVGLSYVMDMEKYSCYRSLQEVAHVYPIAEKAHKKIHEIAYEVKKRGVSQPGVNRLRDVIRQETETEHVVIALTELSVLLQSQKKSMRSQRVIIDALEVYASYIADRYLNKAQPRELFEKLD